MSKQALYTRIGVMLIITLVFVGSALAQEEVQLLEEAKTLLAEGNLEEAQVTLEAVRLSLWNKLPMRVEKVTFVEEEPQSFGFFRKRSSNLFAAGERILLYGEPKNYTILHEDNLYHVFFVADAKLYDSEGNLLMSKEEFLSARYVTQSPVFEVFLNLSFGLTGLEAGDYVLEVILRDKFSEKSAQFKMPFKVR